MRDKRPTTLSFAVLVLLGAMGCEEDNGTSELCSVGQRTPAVARTDLIGTWVFTDGSYTKSITIDDDGRYTDDEAVDCRPHSGEWSLRGSAMALSSPESGECSYVAQFGNNLYFYAILRIEGSGAGLDGTWESGSCCWYADETGSMLYESRSVSTLTISGETVVEERQSVELEEGERFEESRRSSGDLRVDGEDIYVTYTERDGLEVPEHDRREETWGWLVADGVMIRNGNSSEPFVRQP